MQDRYIKYSLGCIMDQMKYKPLGKNLSFYYIIIKHIETLNYSGISNVFEGLFTSSKYSYMYRKIKIQFYLYLY